LSGFKKELNMAEDNQAAECSPTCCTGTEPPFNYGRAEGANWVEGKLDTAAGTVYKVSTALDRQDRLGSIKARIGMGRMQYSVPTGLYAIGKPGSNSPVLVSANYKLSFDLLRRELAGLNLWLLVIDTRGINVWCAAGKGTFGTAEIIKMVDTSGLSKVVSHRTLILPQLAAPGVAAHEVRRSCGFKIIYGPVRAADIPVFLSKEYKADPEMRRTRFNLSERMILVPVELAALVKPFLGLVGLLFLLNLLAFLSEGREFTIPMLLGYTGLDFIPFLAAALIGVALVPALLPYTPGRPLSWKGFVLGIAWSFVYTCTISQGGSWLQVSAYFLSLPAITAFLSLNFTGSTTYTSLSGVVKEMSVALPLIAVSAALGFIALIAAYFV